MSGQLYTTATFQKRSDGRLCVNFHDGEEPFVLMSETVVLDYVETHNENLRLKRELEVRQTVTFEMNTGIAPDPILPRRKG